MKLEAFAGDCEPFFANRIEAAKLLAKRLEGYRGQNPLVLGIPRGAVPAAQVIAEPLGGDLDVVQIPERLSKRQRELYEQLRALEKRGGR